MGRLMNNYFYGKAGKGDFKKSDLPSNRWQLFWEMLRIRLSGLFRMNLMTAIAFIPVIVVLSYNLSNILMISQSLSEYGQNGYITAYNSETEQYEETEASEALIDLYNKDQAGESSWFWSSISTMCLWLIPCILITGPVQAGMAYVCRNWARDEHAFIWSDFKDAVKGNWKQALGVSLISSIVPLIAVECWYFYGQMASQQGSLLYTVLQMLTAILAAVWFLSLTFSYPMMVGYSVTFRQLIKNSLIVTLARLPHTLGIRLITLIPAILTVAAMFLFGLNWLIGGLILIAWYVLIGNALTRFIHASFTNGVFEKFINPHIPGAQSDIGLRREEDDDDDEPVEGNAELPGTEA